MLMPTPWQKSQLFIDMVICTIVAYRGVCVASICLTAKHIMMISHLPGSPPFAIILYYFGLRVRRGKAWYILMTWFEIRDRLRPRTYSASQRVHGFYSTYCNRLVIRGDRYHRWSVQWWLPLSVYRRRRLDRVHTGDRWGQPNYLHAGIERIPSAFEWLPASWSTNTKNAKSLCRSSSQSHSNYLGRPHVVGTWAKSTATSNHIQHVSKCTRLSPSLCANRNNCERGRTWSHLVWP